MSHLPVSVQSVRQGKIGDGVICIGRITHYTSTALVYKSASYQNHNKAYTNAISMTTGLLNAAASTSNRAK